MKYPRPLHQAKPQIFRGLSGKEQAPAAFLFSSMEHSPELGRNPPRPQPARLVAVPQPLAFQRVLKAPPEPEVAPFRFPCDRRRSRAWLFFLRLAQRLYSRAARFGLQARRVVRAEQAPAVSARAVARSFVGRGFHPPPSLFFFFLCYVFFAVTSAGDGTPALKIIISAEVPATVFPFPPKPGALNPVLTIFPKSSSIFACLRL